MRIQKGYYQFLISEKSPNKIIKILLCPIVMIALFVLNKVPETFESIANRTSSVTLLPSKTYLGYNALNMLAEVKTVA